MVVFPNAKINIGLRILSQRDDGYHNLESVFYPIGLCDILEIVKAGKFSFQCSGLPISGTYENNLVVKAYELMKTKFAIGPAAIHLHKVIPMCAGLGGGSSDATFALKTLNELFELKLSDEQLQNESEKLGSDCPFFIMNAPAKVSGKGEIIERFDLNLTQYWIKIVHPGIEISTKSAFSGINPKNNTSSLKSITNGNIKNNFNRFINDFEQTIFPSHPILKEIKEGLIKEGAMYASMSGSGSAIYGIFTSEPLRNHGAYFEYIEQLKF